MLEYLFLIATAFFAVLFYFSIRDSFRAAHPRIKVFKEPEEKLLVLDQGEDLQIEGGELEPDFYYRFVQRLKELEKKITVEFICGAKVLISQDHHPVVPAKRKGRTKNMHMYHPLFEFAHYHPGRLELFLRIRSDGNDIHYSVGTSAKLICQEEPHRRGDKKIGTFHYYDVPRWQILRIRFQETKQKSIEWTPETEVAYEIV